MEGVLFYHEVFASIQGESSDMGIPCVFVRLYGCNVNCSYCDQPQSNKDKHKISIGNLVDKIQALKIKNVCITGGEPLLQADNVYQLVLELKSLDYKISIETNGCIKIPEFYFVKNVKFVMDVKCPSSKVSNKNVLENLMSLRTTDEVKFVIDNREDYDYMKKVLKDYPTPAKKLVSPVFRYTGSNNYICKVGYDLVQWLLKDQLYNFRVQVQMHKCLGVK